MLGWFKDVRPWIDFNADGVNNDIENALKESGVKDMTAKYGNRLVKKERCDYLRPTIIHCDSPDLRLDGFVGPGHPVEKQA